MKGYQIIAHTGCEGMPYNSAASCQAGFEAGADILEVDVRATKDGEAVLYHDDEPDFARYTYAEWVNAGHDPVERLENVLKLFVNKPVRFNLDLKTALAYEAAAKVADRLGAWSQVFFTGVTDHLAHGIHAKHVVWNLPRMAPDLSEDDYAASIRQYCEKVKQAGFVGINAQYESCRKSLIAHAAQYGLFVWIYTLPADERLLAAYTHMGVTAISVKEVSTCMKLLSR